MAAIITIKHRRGTATQWTSAATVLAAGEFGVETDTGLFKIGDGTTAWASLGYAAITTAAGDTRYLLASTKGQANGIASLDAGGKIPSAQLPALRIVKVATVANQSARLALASNDDAQFVVQSDTSETYILGGGVDPTNNANWTKIPMPSTAGLQAISEKDQANGYAGLDSNGKLKVAEFPTLDGGTP